MGTTGASSRRGGGVVRGGVGAYCAANEVVVLTEGEKRCARVCAEEGVGFSRERRVRNRCACLVCVRVRRTLRSRPCDSAIPPHSAHASRLGHPVRFNPFQSTIVSYLSLGLHLACEPNASAEIQRRAGGEALAATLSVGAQACVDAVRRR